MPFASRSTSIHLVRGLIGLLAVIGAVAGVGLGAPVTLILLLVAVAAWRGCPTCWMVGLMQTREREAACRGGRCASS